MPLNIIWFSPFLRNIIYKNIWVWIEYNPLFKKKQPCNPPNRRRLTFVCLGIFWLRHDGRGWHSSTWSGNNSMSQLEGQHCLLSEGTWAVPDLFVGVKTADLTRRLVGPECLVREVQVCGPASHLGYSSWQPHQHSVFSSLLYSSWRFPTPLWKPKKVKYCLLFKLM